ncbi:hypothetical protein AAL_07342 [Moelleriella libera RCEF 2490]|uniref:Uncharacterized protein n=1 Tax=Moelleriella libera RCEF 2490 TaxID=1081109 RepID=A0A167XLR1_9HYPO|nr:hypothetical protein AAL_07342 [Moelleriella libera RCEF 2490]
MEDDFVPVNTWQGCIMVSTSLLPLSNDEKTRIYPECRDQMMQVGTTGQQGDGRGPQATASRRPPVPDYWNHEPHKGVGAAMASHNMGSLYSPSPSSSATMSAYSIHAQDPVMGFRNEEDCMSTHASGAPLFAPWAPTMFDAQSYSPTDWEDATAATSPASLPQSTASGPSTPLLNFNGLELVDDRQHALGFNSGYFMSPASPELQPTFKRRRSSASWHQ